MHKNRSFQLTAILLILGMLLYLLPLAGRFGRLSLSPFTNDDDGLNAAAAGSIVIACTSSLLTVQLSLLVAIGLRHITINSTAGKWLTILLLPALLGNVTTAFIWKLILADPAIFHNNGVARLLALEGIQCWQYGTLYIYIFWLAIGNIPKARLLYARATAMTPAETIRDLVLPACQDLAVLLFIINACITVYDDSKLQFIFRSSRGTGDEPISQWLTRNYQSTSLISQTVAVKSSLQVGMIVTITALLSLLAAALFFLLLYKKANPIRPLTTGTGNKGPALLVALLAGISAPLIYALVTTVPAFHLDLTTLLQPFILTAFSAMMATATAILFAILLRRGWTNIFNRLNGKAIRYFIILFCFQLFTPITLLIAGIQWVGLIHLQGPGAISAVWMTGHIILVLPVLGSFLTVTHFRTSNPELEYLGAYRLSFGTIAVTSFIRRYALDYIFTFLVAFSFIWNEPIINNIMSDYIPSFVSQLKMSIEGRDVDYARGMNYLLVSLTIGIVSIWLWRAILNRATTKYEYDQV